MPTTATISAPPSSIPLCAGDEWEGGANGKHPPRLVRIERVTPLNVQVRVLRGRNNDRRDDILSLDRAYFCRAYQPVRLAQQAVERRAAALAAPSTPQPIRPSAPQPAKTPFPTPKLAPEQVREIMALRAKGETYEALAKAYNVSPSTIYCLFAGKTYRGITGLGVQTAHQEVPTMTTALTPPAPSAPTAPVAPSTPPLDLPATHGARALAAELADVVALLLSYEGKKLPRYIDRAYLADLAERGRTLFDRE